MARNEVLNCNFPQENLDKSGSKGLEYLDAWYIELQCLLNVIKNTALLDTCILLADNLQHSGYQMHCVCMEIIFFFIPRV
jgi:hypothetical protein